MSGALLEMDHIFKSYGERVVLNGITLTVTGGEVVGLLGANGAGKSTTARIISGLIQPDAGQVSIAGHRLADQPEAALANLGYMPEDPFLYPELTVMETLEFIGDLRGVADGAWIERSLTGLDLQDARHRRVAALSLGMRRKLSLAAAFAGEPPLMLLDEPTNGLDPPAVALFKDIVVELRRRGRGVLISSHLLALLEPLCDRLAILEAGEFRACGSLAAIRQQHHLDATADLEQVYLVLTGRTRSAAAALFSTVETPANAR